MINVRAFSGVIVLSAAFARSRTLASMEGTRHQRAVAARSSIPAASVRLEACLLDEARGGWRTIATRRPSTLVRLSTAANESGE